MNDRDILISAVISIQLSFLDSLFQKMRELAMAIQAFLSKPGSGRAPAFLAHLLRDTSSVHGDLREVGKTAEQER